MKSAIGRWTLDVGRWTFVFLIVIGVVCGIAFDRTLGFARFRSPKSEISPPTPTPAPFVPDPEVLAFANAVLAQRPWLFAESTDPNTAPGVWPGSTVLRTRAEPIVEKAEDGWRITFRQP